MKVERKFLISEFERVFRMIAWIRIENKEIYKKLKNKNKKVIYKLIIQITREELMRFKGEPKP